MEDELIEVFGGWEQNPTLLEEVVIADVQSLGTADAHIVKITAVIGADIVSVSGTSRRHPEDKPNAEIGELLAQARAYQALGNKIAKRARGLVAQQDHNKAIKPAQREARQRWEIQQRIIEAATEIRANAIAEYLEDKNQSVAPGRRSHSANDAVVVVPM